MKRAANIIIAILTIVSGMLLWSAAPQIEAWLFPILTDQQPTAQRTGKNGAVVQMENIITKNRNCPLEAIEFQVIIHGPVVVSRQPIPVVNSSGIPVATGELRKYPPGRIHTGPFEANLPSFFYDADEIIGLSLYRCHPFWTTPQLFGPFKIPPSSGRALAPAYSVTPRP